MSALVTRRALVTGGAGLLLAGCDRVQSWAPARKILLSGDKINYHLQRALIDRGALAPEYRPDQMSPVFRTNGSTDPGTDAYHALAGGGFADWRLQVTGLVARPLALSLAQLHGLPQRAQITRHDCVEGWSAIGQWRGPQLRTVLKLAGIRAEARYIVFRCADRIGGTPYYESIDLVDAFHPQTILATQLNGRPLSVGHGAPARLRVERQLGYKQAKYVMAIEAVPSLGGVGQGKGGYWEDRIDYDWYAGI
ncbi:molybdopterin-dependent oxidoreductase [uncultured Sphingomonas sp.]|uniref:molybdopterin-dependent oxidoreductase n=1 Tax=uncultured Sphingomonas sp. TaxID=158754 RepID=UPI0035CB7D6B